MTPGPRVSFLVAGVQKAGTSALFEYLRRLPGVRLPAVKEAHHFDDEGVDWAAPDHRPYHALFAGNEDGDEAALWGDATPIYLYWPGALERIARYDPAMRLILIFRDPVERAWSHWKMEFVRGKEREPFAWCIREGRERLADALPNPGFHRVFSYVERGFYGRQLAHALALFPREQLLLLRAADLAREPDATLRRVTDFLGLPPPAPVAPVRALETVPHDYGPPPGDADIALLDALYAGELAQYEALGGPRLTRDPKALSLEGRGLGEGPSEPQ